MKGSRISFVFSLFLFLYLLTVSFICDHECIIAVIAVHAPTMLLWLKTENILTSFGSDLNVLGTDHCFGLGSDLAP